MVYGRKQASKQASKQANMHTHVCNAVSLVWGLLRLVPTRQAKLQIDSESVMNLVNVLTQHALDWTAHGQLSIVIQFAISNYYPITCPQFKHSNYSSCFEVKLQLQITVFENCNCYVVITFGFQLLQPWCIYYMTACLYEIILQFSQHMWQSQEEIEHYSIVYFDCIITFEAL